MEKKEDPIAKAVKEYREKNKRVCYVCGKERQPDEPRRCKEHGPVWPV